MKSFAGCQTNVLNLMTLRSRSKALNYASSHSRWLHEYETVHDVTNKRNFILVTDSNRASLMWREIVGEQSRADRIHYVTERNQRVLFRRRPFFIKLEKP